MNAIEIIALIALIVLILQNATQICVALAELLRACLPVVDAVRDLIAAISNSSELPVDIDRPELPVALNKEEDTESS